jgi:hypothetical protein
MYHQFSRLTLVVTSSTLGSGEIDDIEAAVLGYQANLVVKDGLSKDAAEEQSFSWATAFSDATVTSDRRVVYTGGESMTKIKIASVTLDGYERKFPVPAQFDRQLEPGKSYTLTISFKMLRWARSNIYWDDVAKTLTFVPADGTTDYEGYQGVFFMWGSLVGVSPAQNPDEDTDAKKNVFTDSVPIYVPYDYPAAPKWKKTEGRKVKDDPDIPAATDNWRVWGYSVAPATHIPFMDGTYATSGEVTYQNRTDTYVMDAARNTDAVYQGLRGDICQYLSKTGAVAGNYRMPMVYEFGRGSTGWDPSPNMDGWETAGLSATINTLGNESGTAILIKGEYPYNRRYITNSAMGGVVLPAGGFRSEVNGNLSYVGYSGDYWTGSVYSAIQSYGLNFNNTGTNGGNWKDRCSGRAVRCVVN